MKKIIAFGLALVMFLIPCAVSAEETEPGRWEIPLAGADLTIPQSWVDSGYYFEYETNEYSDDLRMTTAMFFSGSEEELVEAAGQYGGTREFEKLLSERVYSTFYLLSVRNTLSEEDIMVLLRKVTGEDPSMKIREIAQADGWTFYDLTGDSLVTKPEPYEGGKETIAQVLADIPEVYNDAHFYGPAEKEKLEDGLILSFETVDVNGNKVSSKELFSRNSYTLVNLWTSWCTYCVQEMPELENMSAEFAAGGGGVIGILLDGDEEKGLEDGKAVLEETGVTYPILIPTKEMIGTLDTGSYPTTVIVDSNGVVVGEPIEGMKPDVYRERMTELLTGVSYEAEENTAEAEAENYRVVVLGINGAPVPGVMVEFCSDTQCMSKTTDDNGEAVFEQGAGQYTVHILKAPDGHTVDPGKEYEVPERPGTVMVLLDD